LTTEAYNNKYSGIGTRLQEKYNPKTYNQHPLFDVLAFGRILSVLFFEKLAPPPIESLPLDPFLTLY
jgi:hypothetical protein